MRRVCRGVCKGVCGSEYVRACVHVRVTSFCSTGVVFVAVFYMSCPFMFDLYLHLVACSAMCLC